MKYNTTRLAMQFLQFVKGLRASLILLGGWDLAREL